jgi:hypothetical protein
MSILHFECFQEADCSSLEENVLIRIAGDKDSYADFVTREKFEKGGFFMFRGGRY